MDFHVASSDNVICFQQTAAEWWRNMQSAILTPFVLQAAFLNTLICTLSIAAGR
jgi:hypothetical protein